MARVNSAPVLDAGDSINRGLRGFWPLAEGAGFLARDISPYRQHGRWQSAPGFQIATPPAGGRAAYFASGNYIDIPSFRWPGATGVTVAFWVKTGTNGNNSPFYVGPTPTSEPNLFFAHTPYFDNTLYWRYGTYGTDVSVSFSAYLDKWTHVALVNNGANFKGVYFNGVLAASGTTVATPPVAASGMKLGDGSWVGAISGFRIYTRGLTGREIRRLATDPWVGTVQRRRLVVSTSASAAYNETLSDAVAAGDSIAGALAALGSLSDALTAAEALAAALGAAAAASDAGTAADSLSATRATAASLSDPATGADAASGRIAAGLSASDAATGGDAAAGGFAVSLSASDAATAADSLAAALGVSASLSDAATAADALAAALSALAQATDATAAADLAGAVLAAAEALADALAAADAISLAGLSAPAYRTVRALLRARAAVARAEDRTITAPYRTRTISAEE